MKKKERKRKCGPAEFAEIKLLAILPYYILGAVIILTTQSFTAAITPRVYLTALLPYSACESTGVNATKDCESLLSQVQQPQLFNLSVAHIIILSFSPLVLFLFSTNFKLYIKHLKKVVKKVSG